MILITGATGQLGHATIEHLIKKVPASQLAILARDKNKTAAFQKMGIDVRIGDYNSYSSLLSAFQHIDKVFFISGTDVANREQQHENVVKAAKEAGVKHIVYTSFARKNETTTNPLGVLASSHINTDKLIKDSGMTYTILQNGLYAEVLPLFFGDKVLESGIYLPAGNGKAAYIAREDIAEVAANILSTDGHDNKVYKIANAENYSLQHVAQILSDVTGKQVTYYSPSQEEYSKKLLEAGVPKEYVGMFASFSEAIKQGEFETTDSDMEKLLGRKPVTLQEYFKQTYSAN
jgi:NAD(P)H dehydrogenase (quinone)